MIHQGNFAIQKISRQRFNKSGKGFKYPLLKSEYAENFSSDEITNRGIKAKEKIRFT